jgi:hypothetical protein
VQHFSTACALLRNLGIAKSLRGQAELVYLPGKSQKTVFFTIIVMLREFGVRGKSYGIGEAASSLLGRRLALIFPPTPVCCLAGRCWDVVLGCLLLLALTESGS